MDLSQQTTRSQGYLRLIVLMGIVVLAVLSRLIPHPPNFAPIGAIALFGGAFFPSKRLAFAIPIIIMFLGDLMIAWLSGNVAYGIHPLIPFVYGSFALIVCLGFWLKGRQRFLSVAGAALTGSVLFFIITNFGVWIAGDTYPLSWEGLTACYVAAIPFFKNTVLGDAVYTAALFGGLFLVEKYYPQIKTPSVAKAEYVR